jgi:ABC-type nitrate/sulfonate/bicarbonate transport system substrate-binding protein
MRRSSSGASGLSLAATIALLALVSCAAPASAPNLANVATPARDAASSGSSAAAPSGAPTAPATHIVMAETTVNAVYWPTIVMMVRGMDRDENLDLDYLESRTSADGARYMVAGDAQVTSVTTETAIIAAEQDPGIFIAGGWMWWVPHSLVAAKDVATVADLRGKTVSVDQVRGGNGLYLRRMLAAGGLGADDYSLIQGGASRERLAGLVSGSVQGTLLLSPDNARMVRDGYQQLGYVNDYIGANYFTPLITTRRWAEANPEAFLRFLRATNRAITWLNDPANRAEAIAMLADQSRISPEDASITYDEYVPRKVHSLAITPEQVQGALDTLVELGQLSPPTLPPERYLDLTYLRRLGQ